MSLKFRILFALSCTVLAFLLLYMYTEHVRSEATQDRSEAVAALGGDVVKLAVAVRTLEAGDVIQQGDVELRDWIAEMAPTDAYTTLDDLVGKEVTSVVAKGVVLSALNFRETTDIAEIPSNNIAFTISINDRLGISRTIERGSKLFAYKVDGQGVVLIAKDIEVLSGKNTNQKGGQAAQITLAIPYEWAEAVIEAQTTGDLRLVEPSEDSLDVEIGTTQAPAEIAAESKSPEDAPAASATEENATTTEGNEA